MVSWSGTELAVTVYGTTKVLQCKCVYLEVLERFAAFETIGGFERTQDAERFFALLCGL